MSYAFIGAKWGNLALGTPSGKVTWSADLSDDLKYNASLYGEDDFLGALRDAFDSWENAASVDFAYVSNPSGADIFVDMAPFPGSVAGLASLGTAAELEPGKIVALTNVDIQLDSLMTWAPFGGAAGSDFYAVALHEIGHAIGLEHVDDTSEIMNPVLSTDELGDGDILGAQVLYGADPGDAVSAEAPSSGGGAETASAESDGGGGGGGVMLLLGLLASLVAALFGGGGAAVAMASFAGKVDDDDTDQDDDPAGAGAGEELMAFLDHAYGGAAGDHDDIHALTYEDAFSEPEEAFV